MASQWDGLKSDFASRLRGLVAESGGRVTLVSGYRSPERQAQLFNDALRKYGSVEAARKWVAPAPGQVAGATGSNHNHGSAFDLGGDLQLAHQLAPKYGLKFPMSHEPWHVESADHEGDESAYTTPPEEVVQQQQAPQEDHVDKMMSRLSGVFDGLVAGEVGENDITGAGEATNAAAGEFGPNSFGTEQQQEPIAVEGEVAPVAGGVATAVGASKGLNAEQLANANIIARVGKARGLSNRAIQIAIATALQESGLRNISHGDRDSVGLFQQRTSQGWGSVKDIMNPEYSAGKFYDGLQKVKGYEQMPLTKAAQTVQRSAYPDAYAKWEKTASDFVSQLGD